MAKSAQIDKVKTLEGSKSNKGEIFDMELKLLQGSEATMVTDQMCPHFCIQRPGRNC